MINPALIVALMVGGAVVFIFWGLWRSLGATEQVIEERLGRYAARKVPAEGKGKEPRSALAPVTDTIDRAIARRDFATRISTELARADLKLTPSEYILLNIASILICFFLGFLLRRQVLTGILGAIVGLYLPRSYVRYRQRSRLNAFNAQLGDAINLLANSLRSGFSLLQAMDTVANELSPPISTEFARVVREVGLGLTTEQALNNMLRRIRSDDLDLMVTAINVQHEVGGNLAEILETISHTIRERIRIQGEIRVLTAQQMLSGYLISFLPVAIVLFLWLLSPTYIGAMFRDPCGWVMLGTAGTGILLGFLIIRKIVHIEV